MVLALVASALVINGRDTMALDANLSNDFELGDPPTDADILGDGVFGTGPDWGDLFTAAGGFKDVIDENGAAAVNGVDDYIDYGGIAAAFLRDDLATAGRQDKTVFAKSNKNNDLIQTWNWDTGNVPAKDDIPNAYTYATLSTQDEFEGDLIIYAGVERLSPNGASHVDIEFNQNNIDLDKALPCGDDGSAGPDDPKPCEFVREKTENDFVVSMDFTQGGSLGSLEVRR